MILRPASVTDAVSLAQLGRDSFCAKFAHLYAPADLLAFLEQAYSVDVVREEIIGEECIHQLAEDGEEIVGYCKLRLPSGFREHSDAHRPIALSQLYTAPALTGRGIGAALMDWAMAEARRRGCDAIQLSVFSGNEGAQRFYERYGFAKIADIDFWVGDHRDDEFLFELRL